MSASILPFVGPGLGLLGSLFGGGSQSSQNVTPGSTTQQAIPDWLLPLYQSTTNFLQSNLGRSFGYPGQLQVGMSPLSQQAYSDIGSLAGLTPLAGGQLGADITGAYVDPTQNPVVQNMVAMLNQQYGPNSLMAEDALRKLHGNFGMISPASGAQGYSGAASAEGNLLGTLQANLASQIANLLQNVYGAERGIQSNATSQALNIPASMQNIGNVPTALAQSNIQSQQGDWLNQLRQMFSVPSGIFPSVGSAFYPSYYTPEYGANPLSSIGSGFSSLYRSGAFTPRTNTTTTTPVEENMGGGPFG